MIRIFDWQFCACIKTSGRPGIALLSLLLGNVLPPQPPLAVLCHPQATGSLGCEPSSMYLLIKVSAVLTLSYLCILSYKTFTSGLNSAVPVLRFYILYITHSCLPYILHPFALQLLCVFYFSLWCLLSIKCFFSSSFFSSYFFCSCCCS